MTCELSVQQSAVVPTDQQDFITRTHDRYDGVMPCACSLEFPDDAGCPWSHWNTSRVLFWMLDQIVQQDLQVFLTFLLDRDRQAHVSRHDSTVLFNPA